MPPKQTKANVHPLKYTSFNVVGYLNAKNVASSFAKSDSQSWFSRRSTTEEWDQSRESKRRRLMASEEEIDQVQERTGDEAVAGKPKISVLKSAPEGAVKSPTDTVPTSTDALARTIVIHPGSRWLRIGRACDPAPLAIPNVIARKSRTFAPNPSTMTNGNGKGKEPELVARTPAPVSNGDTAIPPSTATNGASTSSAPLPVPSQSTLPPLPGTSDQSGDATMSELSAPRDDDDEYNSDGSLTPQPADAHASTQPLDPMSAKISSLKADLRARMRAFKMRGQGNGNSQAAMYNATVKAESMGEGFEGDHDWTTGEQEVWVGNKAVRIPDPLASGYVLRHPFQRGDFNTVGYVSQQEFLGDVETLYATVLKDELGIAQEDLKDYSVIFLIPDLYEETYVREMSNLLLTTLGFKQLCVMQESICSTFGAGISSACVIDIGASQTKITCIEEGLVLPETRMVLDFGGDDITSFLLSLLLRNGFPYRETDLNKWYDWIVLEDLKERSVVLSEGDIGLNLYDFYIRHPGQSTQKYTLRMYDDCILAPYALFAPRVIDFDKKFTQQPQLWSKDVDSNLEIGQGGLTMAMKNSTRHLFLPTTSVPLAANPSLAPPSNAGETPLAGSPAPSQSGTVPNQDPSTLGSTPLPPLPGLTPTTPSLAGSPAPERAPPPLAATALPPFTPQTIDHRVESSKIPLDVAIVESILAAGAEERMKKVAANMSIVGGTGGIHNVGFAIESRVAPQLVARIPSLSGHVSYVPSPREIEPENLAWKGISVLTRLDAANELWIRREEWEMLGMRGLRDRAFYWAS